MGFYEDKAQRKLESELGTSMLGIKQSAVKRAVLRRKREELIADELDRRFDQIMVSEEDLEV